MRCPETVKSSVLTILPSFIAPTSQALKQYLDLEQYFPVQIQKTGIIVLFRNVLTRMDASRFLYLDISGKENFHIKKKIEIEI